MHSTGPFRVSVLLTALLLPLAGFAQTDASPGLETPTEADYANIPDDAFRLPSNTISIGVRVSGSATVQFSGLGSISNDTMPTADVTTEMIRIYADGIVGVDVRFDANGDPLPRDGKTNLWTYQTDGQVAADQSGIFMTSFAAVTSGATVEADSGAIPGFDIEVSRRIGGSRLTWGVQAGLGLNDINAKTSGDITASLRTLKDFYSLMGATPPAAPYQAPQFDVNRIANPDGTFTDVVTDISVLLASLPSSRTDTLTADAAQISGRWQVRGAYFTARLGPWIELPISQRLTLRASGGVSGTVLGASMRFDERFTTPGPDGGELAATDQTDSDSWSMFGGFAAVEASWWVTERSGFFAGATYEAISGDVEIKAGDRTANMNVESGAGVRLGFTTRF